MTFENWIKWLWDCFYLGFINNMKINESNNFLSSLICDKPQRGEISRWVNLIKLQMTICANFLSFISYIRLCFLLSWFHHSRINLQNIALEHIWIFAWQSNYCTQNSSSREINELLNETQVVYRTATIRWIHLLLWWWFESDHCTIHGEVETFLRNSISNPLAPLRMSH